MSIKLKATIVVFGKLSQKGMHGLSLFNYKIAKHFYDNNSLTKVYCLDCDKSLDIPKSKINCLNNKFPLYISLKLVRYTKKIFPNFPARLISELLFDLYFSATINFNESNLLLNLKPVNPYINNKAIKDENKIITLATVAHPSFIREMIRKMEARYRITDTSSYSNKRRISRLRKTFITSDMIIPRVNSNFIVNTFTSNGVSEDKLKLLKSNNRIDFDIYSPGEINETKPYVDFLSVGFMNLKKGLPLLLEAWRDLKNHNKMEGKLTIIGKMDNPTKKAIGQFDHERLNVVFYGHLHGVDTMYKKSDVFIASSVSDLQPRTVIEAMGCGLPVIVSTHCGSADLVNEGENGFLYNPFDLERLKSLILWFTVNKDKLPTMRKIARQKILERTSNNFYSDIYKACESVINE